jgi:hypothetical protein
MTSPSSLTRRDALNGPGVYPTKEEILNSLYVPTTAELQAVSRWTTTYYKGWMNLTESQKFFRLKTLLSELCIAHGVDVPRYQVGWFWGYFPDSKLISAEVGKPSIISLLHETGHHIFGHSELTACTYSVGIFKQCFPKAYDKLVWKGHLLVRP